MIKIKARYGSAENFNLVWNILGYLTGGTFDRTKILDLPINGDGWSVDYAPDSFIITCNDPTKESYIALKFS